MSRVPSLTVSLGYFALCTVPEETVRNHHYRCASVDLSLRASVTAAECECRLGFLASGSWCEAMPLGRRLAVYCLDVAFITVSSLACLTSIAVVALALRLR